MFMLNDRPLALDTPFEHKGIRYPANWLRLTSLEEKQAIGITEVADPVVYDDRFYWGVGNPKDLNQCKANLISQIKSIANSLLAPTDWKIIRAVETGTDVSQDILDVRANIRNASNSNEVAINNATNVEELSKLQFVWPEI